MLAPWDFPPKVLPPDHNRGEGILIASWILVSIATIIVILRLYTRLHLRSSFGWDDACITFSICLSLAGSVGNTMQVHYGFGRHVWYLSNAVNGQNYKWLVICQLLSFSSLFFTRTSICLFCLRILKSANRILEHIIYVALLLNTVASFIAIITYSVQCVPLEGVWDKSIPAKCFNPDVLVTVLKMLGAFGFITDIATVAIPVIALVNLQFDRKTTRALCALLGLGICTAAFAVGKAATVQKSPDQSWVAMPTEYCALFEGNLGIIVACLPALYQLYSSLRLKTYRFRIFPRRVAKSSVDEETAVEHIDKNARPPIEKGLVTVHVGEIGANESLVNIFSILKAMPSTDETTEASSVTAITPTPPDRRSGEC